MARPTITGEPLSEKERRDRSEEARKLIGERRLSIWINPEANAALSALTGCDESRGVIKAAIENALINEAKRQGSKKSR